MSFTVREEKIAKRIAEYAIKYANQANWSIENTPLQELEFSTEDGRKAMLAGNLFTQDAVAFLLSESCNLEELCSDILSEESKE